jgi:hypothetical protein
VRNYLSESLEVSTIAIFFQDIFAGDEQQRETLYAQAINHLLDSIQSSCLKKPVVSCKFAEVSIFREVKAIKG